jgi:hypothetical protein
MYLELVRKTSWYRNENGSFTSELLEGTRGLGAKLLNKLQVLQLRILKSAR